MMTSKLFGQYPVKLNKDEDARILILPAIPTDINDPHLSLRYRNAAKSTTPQNMLSRWSNLARTELLRRGAKPIDEPSNLILMDMQPRGVDRGFTFIEYSEMLHILDGLVVTNLTLVKALSVSFAEWDKPPLLLGLITRDLSFKRDGAAAEFAASFENLLGKTWGI